MKVTELPYRRYTFEDAEKVYRTEILNVKSAKSLKEVLSARARILKANGHFSTMNALSSARYTLNTRDAFYCGEKEYYDEAAPKFDSLNALYAAAMSDSPFRAELEKNLSPTVFKTFACEIKAADPSTVEERAEENALVTKYSNLMSTMEFQFRGENMPLALLKGYLSDEDRETRKDACHALGKGLKAHEKELDSFFDKLVKLRDKTAKKMGYQDFVELGYARMNRIDYDEKKISAFRKNVCEFITPLVSDLKKKLAAELKIDSLSFYDDEICLLGAPPKPLIDADGIFSEAEKMYHQMGGEIGGFMRFMRASGAFDYESRDGKWGGGYCTEFQDFAQPFILANFNGGSDDIDVITHEFGHALASKECMASGLQEVGVGGMETAECHSMSMELLSHPFMDKFFGENADKYRYKHLCSCLSFIPYGSLIDEFQHIVYANPDMTPSERNEAYLKLEKQYRPYLNFEDIPYLEKGTRWQFQMHVYESPFYYIDYCLAQTVALQFYEESLKNYPLALKKYLRFVKKGGTEFFSQLISEAGFSSPFEDGALKKVAQTVADRLQTLKTKIES